MALPAGLALLAGCGHPASAEECDEIFRRSAEIELKAQRISDPGEIRRRVDDARAAKGEELMRECVGKRITDAAMACVRGAETAEEFDGCLR